MPNDMFNVFESFNKTALAAAQQLGAINVRAAEKLFQTQLDLVKDNFEAGSKHMKGLTGIKDINGLLASQAEVSKQYVERALVAAKDTVEVYTEARGELNQWLQTNVDAATPNLKPVSSKKAA